MRAMILAAGRGERLRPVTDTTPKPLLSIAGEALIVHQIRWLAAAGITDIVINLHHLGAQIQAHLGDGARWGVSIRYSIEATRLETGGGIVAALPLLGTKPFLILNGDIWTDYPFAQLPHALGADAAHLVLTHTPAHRAEGDFGLAGDRIVRGAHRPYTYCGIGVLSPALFEAAPPAPFSLRDLFFAAIARQAVAGELFSGQWIDIGTPEQLHAVRQNSN
jgi:MurNAc alpha-1-phosphate uridylyltransferase